MRHAVPRSKTTQKDCYRRIHIQPQVGFQPSAPILISAQRGAVGERKYLDPNGHIFDLTGHEYARDTWQVDVNA